MASIKKRAHSLGATLSENTALNFWTGAGVLVGMSIDYAVAANANTTVKMYDTVLPPGTAVGSLDPSIFVGTTINTDFGTTVPNRCYTDGDLVAGTSTANVKLGVPFARGLYVVVAADVAGPQLISLYIKPLVCKSVDVALAGFAGSAVGSRTVFDGPGLLHGYRIRSDPAQPSTMDFLLKDGIANEIAGTGAGNTLMTKTDIGNQPTPAVRPVVTTTNVDEVQATVTTAATGAYANDGILFGTGLNVSVQQGNAGLVEFDFLIET